MVHLNFWLQAAFLFGCFLHDNTERKMGEWSNPCWCHRQNFRVTSHPGTRLLATQFFKFKVGEQHNASSFWTEGWHLLSVTSNPLASKSKNRSNVRKAWFWSMRKSWTEKPCTFLLPEWIFPTNLAKLQLCFLWLTLGKVRHSTEASESSA